MKQLKIVGSDYKSTLQHTKQCLSETFSPVKKDAKVRSFLKRFLGADNEHTLPNHFVSNNQLSNKEQQYVICYNELDDGIITDQTFCITSSSRLDDDLKTIFRTRFYVDDYILEQMLSSYLIENYIYDNGLDDAAFEAELKTMKHETLCEWLLQSFELSDLIGDDFYCDVLNIGRASISACIPFLPDNKVRSSYHHEASIFRY